MTIETISKLAIEAAKNVDLINLAGQYTTLSRASGTKEMMGPCPKCRGDDRFHVKFGGFFCRQCKRMEDNHDIWYDQIDFVRWMDGCDFATAVEKLTGIKTMNKPSRPVTPVTKTNGGGHAHYTGWQEKADEIVEKSQALLWSELIAIEYLQSRGLSENSILAFRLGFSPAVPLPGTWDGKEHTQPKQPAIVIPWYRGNKVTGIRYRFLEKHEYTSREDKLYKVKTTSLHDSNFTGALYGGQAIMGCAENVRTLVLCEGELNAISIWQMAHPWGFDVLSLGSESTKLTTAALDYAGKFERVVVWMDNPDMVKNIMASIGGAYGVSSPVIENCKQDANAMLKAGTLGMILADVRCRACHSDTERLRLLWNIQDALRLGHMDFGACEVANQIAKGMGVTL